MTYLKKFFGAEDSPSPRHCEEALSQPEGTQTDYSFCPNDPGISAMEQKMS